jgi:hypothetical protein
MAGFQVLTEAHKLYLRRLEGIIKPEKEEKRRELGMKI